VTEATPPDPPASPAPVPGDAQGDTQEFARPRKRFILLGLGIGLLIVLLIGLFTSFGSGSTSSGGGAGGQPQPGDLVPSFAATNIGPSGGHEVRVSGNDGGSGRPTVLLFFGNWCASCHEELPPLAAAVRHQDAAGGALARVRVVGVDSEDSTGDAKSFIESSGVTFPVAYDPNVDITEGAFDFHGDPYTVFVKADGTVSKVVAGAQLGPATFTADERALIPNGS